MYVCKFRFFNECIYEYYINYTHMYMYVCMGECMRCGRVWQVAGSYVCMYVCLYVCMYYKYVNMNGKLNKNKRMNLRKLYVHSCYMYMYINKCIKS
jgi:hypothetical protein